jgi:hypothetical protein
MWASLGRSDLRERFALDAFVAAWCFGKAVAEPPHSTVGWAFLSLRMLRD